MSFTARFKLNVAHPALWKLLRYRMFSTTRKWLDKVPQQFEEKDNGKYGLTKIYDCYENELISCEISFISNMKPIYRKVAVLKDGNYELSQWTLPSTLAEQKPNIDNKKNLAIEWEPTASFIAFIGGAADKYPFLKGDAKVEYLGPTEIVGDYSRYLLRVANQKKLKKYTIKYYGYEEAYTSSSKERPDNAFKDIEKFIQDNPKGMVNIVGHSLGGWNAAGLTSELEKKKICTVNLLITIDPVGVILSKSSADRRVRAQIYFFMPKPHPTKWLSVSCDPKEYVLDDLVADLGGQWESYPKKYATIFHSTKYSHADFTAIMREKINENDSCESLLIKELEKVK